MSQIARFGSCHRVSRAKLLRAGVVAASGVILPAAASAQQVYQQQQQQQSSQQGCVSSAASYYNSYYNNNYNNYNYNNYNYSTSYGSQTSSSVSTCPSGNVSNAVGASTVRATRAFTETLNDRNEDAVKGDGTVGQNSGGLPADTSQYAPTVQASFPVAVRQAPTPAYKIFATGFGGGFSDVGAQTGSYYGGLIGIDYRVMPNLLVGAAAGGSGSRSTLGAFASSGNTAGFNGSIYAIGTAGAFYAQSLTTLSSFSNNTVRTVAAAAGNPTAIEAGSFGSFEARTRLEVGRVLTQKDFPAFGSVKVTPFIALELANLHLNGHTERNINGVGGFANLTTLGQDVTDVPGFVGVRLEKSYDVGSGMVLTPILRLAYVHQFASATGTNSVFAATGASVFSANGTLLARNSAQTKAGAELNLGHNTVVFANFDGLFSGQTSLYGGRGGVRYSW